MHSSLCLDACKTFEASIRQSLGFQSRNFPLSVKNLSLVSGSKPLPCVSCSFDAGNPKRSPSKHREGSREDTERTVPKAKPKGKDNVWSMDNELARAEKERESKRKRSNRVKKAGKRRMGGRVLVSGAMLMEVENVLQTQEPIIRPAWNKFTSSVSGIWKGVGAAFSPITAEMEPIDIGRKSEDLYDCYTFSRIEALPSLPGGTASQIYRKINWVTLNPYGEMVQHCIDNIRIKDKWKDDDAFSSLEDIESGSSKNSPLPQFESFDFGKSDVMEEDLMANDPGLVFFEDGSYSRGPVDIPVGDVDESKYYLSPTFKFEQCLVKGCHTRLRIVHTVEFSNEGADIQIMRVAVYEEQWIGAASVHDECDLELDLKPFSQPRRTHPSELTGSWKVFEVSATPCGEQTTKETEGMPYVYLCTETLKKRSLPEIPVSFGEEEILDMRDATVLWLPGGITGYVDVNEEGILCIGVGWYSDEGVNLVMEREYGTDGKLKDVRWKTEIKGWSDPFSV